jgi:hypothetical protein
MKTLTLILALFLMSVQSFAQIAKDKGFYEQKIIRFNKLKNAGIALTIGGAVLTAVGIAVLANTSFETDYNGEPTNTDKLYLGAYSIGFGMAGMGGGIALAIIGSNKKKQYQRTLDTFSFKLNANPNNTGLVLTYTF